ncbi:MAG: hypothetical protein KJZ64_12160 [Sphingomonadaceae bacterium]|nr:hypothetical protein [Sphingomonadaceae bacterium]
MSEGNIIQLIALVGWLVLMASAYASYKLEWRTMVKQAFVWASIFAGLTLLISWFSG